MAPSAKSVALSAKAVALRAKAEALSAKAMALSTKAGRPGECHLQTLQNDRLEVEDLGVEVNRAEGA